MNLNWLFPDLLVSHFTRRLQLMTDILSAIRCHGSRLWCRDNVLEISNRNFPPEDLRRSTLAALDHLWRPQRDRCIYHILLLLQSLPVWKSRRYNDKEPGRLVLSTANRGRSGL